jgi:hypothetical protein
VANDHALTHIRRQELFADYSAPKPLTSLRSARDSRSRSSAAAGSFVPQFGLLQLRHSQLQIRYRDRVQLEVHERRQASGDPGVNVTRNYIGDQPRRSIPKGNRIVQRRRRVTTFGLGSLLIGWRESRVPLNSLLTGEKYRGLSRAPGSGNADEFEASIL